jgi:hypothetical protein
VQSRKFILPAIMAGAMVAAGFAGSGAATAAQTANPNAAVVHRSTQSAKSVQDYWTPARRKAAKAVAQPEQRPGVVAPVQSTKLPAKSAAGTQPAKAAKAAKATDSAAGVTDVSQSQVWTAHGRMPASTVGKLYFSTAGGNAECTASVVASGNHSMIWTAGHCVTDGAGHWYSNFLFVPDYYNGNWPYGSWAWKSASTPTAYFNGGNLDFDLAAISLWPQSNGRKVADVTGSQGYKFNFGYAFYAYDFGYPYNTHPARAGITGQDLRYCVGWTWQTGNKQAIHCDMGSGASGGPWLDDLRFDRGWGYLIGNTSHHLSASSDEERSPHFGDAAVNVYNAQTNA